MQSAQTNNRQGGSAADALIPGWGATACVHGGLDAADARLLGTLDGLSGAAQRRLRLRRRSPDGEPGQVSRPSAGRATWRPGGGQAGAPLRARFSGGAAGRAGLRRSADPRAGAANAPRWQSASKRGMRPLRSRRGRTTYPLPQAAVQPNPPLTLGLLQLPWRASHPTAVPPARRDMNVRLWFPLEAVQATHSAAPVLDDLRQGSRRGRRRVYGVWHGLVLPVWRGDGI